MDTHNITENQLTLSDSLKYSSLKSYRSLTPVSESDFADSMHQIQEYLQLKQEVLTLRSNKEKLQRENTSLKSKVDNQKDEIDSLKGKNSSLQNEISSLRSELADAQRKDTSDRSQIASLPSPQKTASSSANPAAAAQTSGQTTAHTTVQATAQTTAHTTVQATAQTTAHTTAQATAQTNVFNAASFTVGQKVTFGLYKQAKDGNEKTPIEWVVLADEGYRVLLLADKVIDFVPFNEDKGYVNWKNCSLRKWLNGTFMDQAFSKEGQKKILAVDTSFTETKGYRNVTADKAEGDRVFLLSAEECEKYAAHQEWRFAKPTEAVRANRDLTIWMPGVCEWSLRDTYADNASSGHAGSTIYAKTVGVGTEMRLNRNYINNGQAVRPAIWINTFDLLEKKAKAKDAKAQLIMGDCYYNGIGVVKDYPTAAIWYKHSADQKNVDAMCALAQCYFQGKGAAKNPKEAFRLNLEAAALGYKLSGYGLKPEAITPRFVNALYLIGFAYENGYGTPRKDFNEAAKQYRAVVRYGHEEAIKNLVNCFYNDVNVFEEAARNLVNCFYNGVSVSAEDKDSVKLLQNDAETGNATAQCIIGNCYTNGIAVSKNAKKGEDYYLRSAKQGNVQAQFDLGDGYENGKFGYVDKKKAKEWFTKAADQGNEEAGKRLKGLKKFSLW